MRGDGLNMRGEVLKCVSSMGVEAVEVVGVVDKIGSPAVGCEGVFGQRGDAGVIEVEAPLLGGGKVQEMGE